MAYTASLRLYVDTPLAAGVVVDASEAQAHYLLNVTRVAVGASVLLFNGRDGEWRAVISVPAKRRVQFTVSEQSRPQKPEPDLWVAFAPVKRMDYIAEKTAELGVAALLPVFTQHTAVTRINVTRLQANATEAAEQCERLTVPTVHEAVSFDKLLATWPTSRKLYYLDETGGGMPIAEALLAARAADGRIKPAGFLTGPEGGFAQSELDALKQLSFAEPIGLGPRILRAETAALAAVACWQALLGDWA